MSTLSNHVLLNRKKSLSESFALFSLILSSVNELSWNIAMIRLLEVEVFMFLVLMPFSKATNDKGSLAPARLDKL